MKKRNLLGRRFGRWTVIGFAESQLVGAHRRVFWRCRCECGVERDVVAGNLLQAISRSCGCLQREVVGAMATSHGDARPGRRSSEYMIWCDMRYRCESPAHQRFSYYGGRGIRVCERWRESFANFLADMGRRPRGLSIDRKDNDGDYEPGNCRWATLIEQANNRRPLKLSKESVRMIKNRLASGARVSPLAVEYGLSESMVYRIRRGDAHASVR